MNGIEIVLLSSAVILLASIVQGTVGFGFSLISVPLLSFMFPLKVIVPMVVIDSLVINFFVLGTARKHLQLSKIWLMILCGIIGIPVGIIGLKNINEDILKVGIGFLICMTSMAMAKGYKIRFKNQKLAYGVTGFLSGVLNGSLSMSGPPIVLFLSNEGYDKNQFRANLALYAAITNIITVIAFISGGILTNDMVGTIGSTVVALVLGSTIGIYGSKKIKDKHFDKIVLFLLALVGVITVIKSLWN